MQLTLHSSTEILLVRSMSADCISIGDKDYQASLILLPDAVIADWGITDSLQLTPEHANELLEHKPELVVLGTGGQLVFPSQEFNFTLLRTGVGCEVMDTQAACRTYNVLAEEGRRALAALII